MGWVSFLRAVETASGAADLGSNLNERSASFAVLLSALRDSNSTPGAPERLDSSRGIAQTPALAVIAASSFTVGSRVIPSEEVDRAFGMPAGKLRSRAGIESLAYVAESENELTLAAKAAQEALGAASCGTQELDWIVTTSETHHDYLRFRLNFILDYSSVKTAAHCPLATSPFLPPDPAVVEERISRNAETCAGVRTPNAARPATLLASRARSPAPKPQPCNSGCSTRRV